MEIQTIETKNKKSCPQASELGFGQFFTDHMFVMDYTEGKGWHDPCIHSYKDFSVPPSAMVFHYGQAIFEGLKAYRTPDDKIQLFRPRDNFERMNRSARGMCIPELDIEFVIGALKNLFAWTKTGCPGLPEPHCIFVQLLLPQILFWACVRPRHLNFLSS